MRVFNDFFWIIININGQNRSKITIKYFPKNVDGEKVINALKELNFKVTEGKPKLPDSPTNALYYGRKVDNESIQLVALTLMRAGVEIKGIFPFRNDNTEKDYMIQVLSTLREDKKYTVESIKAFKKKVE